MAAGAFQLLQGVLNALADAPPVDNDEVRSRTIDLQVGKSVHHGVPGNMRTELWLSVLARKNCRGAQAARGYGRLLELDVPPIVAEGIQKDVHRTFPSVSQFATVEGQQRLQRVLLAYAAYDPAVGYCQGLNFLAALMLVWVPGEADAFGCLVTLMQDRGMRELFKEDLQMLQARLWQIGRLLPRGLAGHLEATGALPVLFASSWLLTVFAGDFPVFFSSRVLDVVLVDQFLEPVMRVCVEIVKRCEKTLLAMSDMEKMVQYLRFGVPRWSREKQQELLTAALAQSWTPEQLAVLRQVEGVESVAEAVRRTQNGEAAPEAEEAASPAKVATPSRLSSFKWAARISGEPESPLGPQRGLGAPLGSALGKGMPLPPWQSLSSSAGRAAAAAVAQPGQGPKQDAGDAGQDLLGLDATSASQPQQERGLIDFDEPAVVSAGAGAGGLEGDSPFAAGAGASSQAGDASRASLPDQGPGVPGKDPQWDWLGEPYAAPVEQGPSGGQGHDRMPADGRPTGQPAEGAGASEGGQEDPVWGHFSRLAMDPREASTPAPAAAGPSEARQRGPQVSAFPTGLPPLGSGRPSQLQQRPPSEGPLGPGKLDSLGSRPSEVSIESWGSFGGAASGTEGLSGEAGSS